MGIQLWVRGVNCNNCKGGTNKFNCTPDNNCTMSNITTTIEVS